MRGRSIRERHFAFCFRSSKKCGGSEEQVFKNGKLMKNSTRFPGESDESVRGGIVGAEPNINNNNNKGLKMIE